MEQVVSAAKQAYAHSFIMEMKDGYSTRVGERGGRISGGQRQRIAIARIFLRRPKLILLDEATSALDEDSQAAVQSALDKLIATGGATVVLVAHRLSTVMNADKIAVIDKGQVMEEGSHDELLVKNGIYATLVRKQLAKKASVLDQGKEVLYHMSGRRVRAADDSDEQNKESRSTTDNPITNTDIVPSTKTPRTPQQPLEGSYTTARETRAKVPGLAFVCDEEEQTDRKNRKTPGSKKPFKQRCFHCGEKGHSKKFCPVRLASLQCQPPSEVIEL